MLAPVTTPTEQAFLTMFMMVAPMGAVMNYRGEWSLSFDDLCGPDDHQVAGIEWSRTPIKYIGDMIPTLVAATPEAFPIVASTFEALTIERPELREHYERAKEAWEASQ